VFHAGTAAEWLEDPAAARLDAMRGCGACTASASDPCGVLLDLTTASQCRQFPPFQLFKETSVHLFRGDTMARFAVKLLGAAVLTERPGLR